MPDLMEFDLSVAFDSFDASDGIAQGVNGGEAAAKAVSNASEDE